MSNIPRKRRFYKKNIKGNFDWFDLYLVLTRQFITSNDDQLNGPKMTSSSLKKCSESAGMSKSF